VDMVGFEQGRLAILLQECRWAEKTDGFLDRSVVCDAGCIFEYVSRLRISSDAVVSVLYNIEHIKQSKYPRS
jgi:hypothetical protein